MNRSLKSAAIALLIASFEMVTCGALAQQEKPAPEASEQEASQEATQQEPTKEQARPETSKPEASRKQEVKRIRKVRRVARPKFDGTPSDIWYDDIFTEGLVGDRPTDKQAQSRLAASNTATESSAQDDGKFRWSALIGRDAVEDEIKSLSQSLAKTLTTPVRFKTNSGEVHQSMAMLSLSFALIREYDAEVRWKDNASAAQAALQQAMVNSRANSDQVFNYCNARKLDLEDLVRGGTFPETEKPTETLDWGDVIGRSETMIRLEVADNDLKQWTADKKTFDQKRADIIKQAQWVAAIAEAISREGMDDADSDDYLAFATEMKQAAIGTATSAQNEDYDSASRFANQVSQSCSNCHEEWR